jgi:uncharacterized membrane protein YphA (DoxX/SURF4 family)
MGARNWLHTISNWKGAFSEKGRLAWFVLAIRLVLGGIFIYAGTMKLMDPKAFARIISQYDLIPESLLPVIAIGLPGLEVLAGIGLIGAIPGSLGVIFGLLMLFVGVLWYGILKDLDVDCGCFSAEELKTQGDLWQAFYRDLLMIGTALFLFVSRWWQSGRNRSLPLWAKIKLAL